MATLPLKDLKVLDLSRVLAGPLCTMMLGDLGANVIKVERPGTGDDTRGWGPPFDKNGHSAYFLSVNRNKLSLALDLASPHDIGLVLRLAQSADVVIENFLPGVLSRYGIDRELILAQNARVVWCTISGFGPESTRPGYDFVVQAESGWMAITGTTDTPTKIGVALVDVIAGKDAAISILAAIAGRPEGKPAADRTLHVSLLDSATAALVNVAQNSLVSGTDAKRWGNAHPNLVPYQLFDSANGAIVIAVGTDAQWKSAARALGLDALANDDTLATNKGRIEQRDRVVSAIAGVISTNTSAHWIQALERAGVPCGEVRSVLDALQAVHASPLYGIAPIASGTVRRLPPGLDEHGEIIRKMQWSAFDHLPILP